MANTRLISADSHVAVNLGTIRERVPTSLQEAFDDAIAEQKQIDERLRGGRKLSLEDFDMEAMRDPGYRDAEARLAAMDRGLRAQCRYRRNETGNRWSRRLRLACLGCQR